MTQATAYIDVKNSKRRIEISLPVSPFLEEEVKELKSIASTQNADSYYDAFRLTFCVVAPSTKALDELTERYFEYFFCK